MWAILRYTAFDLIRSKWAIAYILFLWLAGTAFLMLDGEISSAVISMMNVTIIFTPLLSVVFSVVYYYNSRDYVELLLAQPLHRHQIFLGQYLGLAGALSVCLIIGLLLPPLLWAILLGAPHIDQVLFLVLVNLFLTWIFTVLAFWIALTHNDKVKGFGLGIFCWLFLTVVYDAIFLIVLHQLKDYPLQRLALTGTMLNPVDLSRVLMLMKLDISALLGITGAVFSRFFGQATGMITAFGALTVWIVVPMLAMLHKASRKDF